VVKKIIQSDFKAHWVQNLDIESYHSLKDFVSSGGVKYALKSPEHFKEFVIDRNPVASTAAMDFGRLVHVALLEPERFQKHLRVEPEINRRSSIERKSLEVWKESQGPEAIAVAADDLKVIHKIRDRISKHEVAKGLMTIGEREWSGFAKCPRTGLGLRARPDFMDRERGFIMDVKTTIDARKGPFMRKIQDYEYDLSAWMYCHIASLIENRPFENFYILAVEKSPPYPICLFQMDQAFMEIGEQKFKKGIDILKHCFETNQWPSYQDEAELIGPTDWYIKQAADEMMFNQTMEEKNDQTNRVGSRE